MGNNYITKDNSATLKTFINSFVSQEFFINFVKIGLYPSQFGNIALNMSGTNVSEYFRIFLKDLNQTVKVLNIPNHPQISKLISLTNTIYTIRDSNSSVITYDNVFQHIPSLDLPLKTFIEEVRLYRIQDADEFRACTDILLNSIQAYHEVKSISSGLILFDNFDEYATSNNISVFEAIKNYKDIVIQLYNDLSKLQTINKLESEKDYFIISDKKSTFDLSQTLVKHLTSGYSFLQTGYNVFDNNLQGFESSTVHLISAPSNHGKSLLMINLCNKIIRKNIADFKPNDGVLFITLEDNIYKLSRRFCSIFGNIEQKVITELHLKTADVSTAENYISNDDHLQKKFINIFQDIFNNSIQYVIDDKLNLIVKHGPENMVSAGDISKFVDTIKVTENINIKLIFIDYVDTMATTVKSNEDDYVKHGTIVQELRNLSRQYKIPIITASQNSKSSENTQFALNNQQMGDSYRKIKLVHYISNNIVVMF